MRRQTQGGVEEDIIKIAMSFPELPVQVVVPVVGIWPMEVDQIAAKETSHEHDAAKGRQLAGTGGAHAVV